MNHLETTPHRAPRQRSEHGLHGGGTDWAVLLAKGHDVEQRRRVIRSKDPATHSSIAPHRQTSRQLSKRTPASPTPSSPPRQAREYSDREILHLKQLRRGRQDPNSRLKSDAPHSTSSSPPTACLDRKHGIPFYSMAVLPLATMAGQELLRFCKYKFTLR
jgi:hypothetical protein